MTRVATGEQHDQAAEIGRKIIELVESMVAACAPPGAASEVVVLNQAIAVVSFFLMALDRQEFLGPYAMEGIGVALGRYVGQAGPEVLPGLILLLNRGLEKGCAEAEAFMSTAGAA